jgi:hypothetical protein
MCEINFFSIFYFLFLFSGPFHFTVWACRLFMWWSIGHGVCGVYIDSTVEFVACFRQTFGYGHLKGGSHCWLYSVGTACPLSIVKKWGLSYFAVCGGAVMWHDLWERILCFGFSGTCGAFVPEVTCVAGMWHEACGMCCASVSQPFPPSLFIDENGRFLSCRGWWAYFPFEEVLRVRPGRSWRAYAAEVPRYT